MKIYTRKGDQGQTALFGGVRLSKGDLRIEAYGNLDELNAFLGQLGDLLMPASTTSIRKIQALLFNMGAILATAPGKTVPSAPPSEQDIAELERQIDAMEADLSPLKNFILPGGHPAVSSAHICRTVCRRAERQVSRLAETTEIPSTILAFLNRLSDYLFVLSRKIAHDFDVQEIQWTNDTK